MRIRRDSMRRLWLCSVLVVTALLCFTASSHAQTSPPNEFQRVGAQPNRDYLQLQLFERLDTQTGNITLTIPMLSLPGNAGRTLRFEMTYNSNLAIYGWTFGIAGMAMRVDEQATLPVPDPNIQILPETTWGITPRLDMADGSKRRTMFTSSNDVFTTSDFWRYDRHVVTLGSMSVKTLMLPDGTTCWYRTSDGRLVECADTFNNVTFLDWGTNTLTVFQYLGSTQVRQVEFTLNSAGLPTQMRLVNDGRIWKYLYETGYDTELTGVVLPEGEGFPEDHLPEWRFEYSNPLTLSDADRRLTRLITPSGGRIEYQFGPHWLTQEHFEILLDWRRTYDRGFDIPATWELHYDPNALGYSALTTVLTPNGRLLSFAYGPVSSAADPTPIDATLLIDGGIGLLSVTLSDSSGTLQTDQRKYTQLPTVYRNGNAHFDAPVASKTIITRGGLARTTTLSYSLAASTFGDYHHPYQVQETGDYTRTTTYTYTYPNNSTPTSGILILPLTERVVVGSETFEKSWAYNSRTGFLESATIFGTTSTYTPDIVGNVAKVETATRKSTAYFYDWGVVRETRTPEYVITREINMDGTVRSETRGNRRTSFEYDPLGRLRVTQPPGGTHAVTVDYGRATISTFIGDTLAWTHTTTSRGNSFTETGLDGFGRPVTTINSQGVTTRTGYDPEGRIIYKGYPFNPTGTVANQDIGTTITYDGLGRITDEMNPDGSHRTRSYSGRNVTLTDEEGRTTTQTWFAFGDPDDARLAQLTDADNKIWGYTYHALGQLWTVGSPDGLSRTFVYNAQNLLWKETHPESGTTTYAYDPAGVLASKTDANAQTITYSYDGNDRLRAVTGGGRTTVVAYEPGTDNRQWISNGAVDTTFLYDQSTGRLKQRQDVIDKKLFVVSYDYDDDDNLTAITYPSGRELSYTYYSEHQIEKVRELATGRDYAFGFAYHPSGAVRQYTSNNLTTTLLEYDPARYWPTRVTSGPLSLTYGNYDGVGNVRQITDSRSSFGQTLEYDVLDRLRHATSAAYGEAIYEYEVSGNRKTVTGSSYIYDYFPGTLRLKAQGPDSFTYDNNGNLKTRTGASSASYTYTPANMLETATVDATSTSYIYDADDWRVKKSNATSSTYFIRGPSGELLTEWTDPGALTGHIRDYVYAGSRLISAIDKSSIETPTEAGTGVPPNFTNYSLLDTNSSLASQLVGLFVVNEGSGTTTTNRVNGTLAMFAGTTTPTWNTADPSVVFPGGSAGASYVDAGQDLVFDALPTNPLTVVAKVWVTSVAAPAVVAAKSVGTAYFGAHGFVFGWDANGALRMQIGRAYTNYTAATQTGVVTTGHWMQVAMTWDPATTSGHLFIDGVEKTLASVGAGDGGIGYTYATYQPFQIGTGSSNYLSGTMNGRLAYVAVYKGRLLTTSELTQLDAALPISGGTVTAITPNAGPMTVSVPAAVALQFSTTGRQIATVQLSQNTVGSVIMSLISPDGTVLRTSTSDQASFTLPPTAVVGTNRILLQPLASGTGTVQVALTLSDLPSRPLSSLVDESAPLSAQLAGLFLLNEASGSFTTNLVSGQLATFAGATAPVWNATDPSVVFPGGASAASYVNAGVDLSLDGLPTNQLTVAAKVWVTNVASGVIASKSVGTAYFGAQGFVFGWDASGALGMQIGRAYTNYTAATRTGGVTAGRWLQLAMTWDPVTTSGHLFIDGVEQPMGTLGAGDGGAGYTSATYQPLQIGSGSSNFLSGTINGKLAYLAIYKGRVLSAAELTELDAALPISDSPETSTMTPNSAPVTATVTQPGTGVMVRFVAPTEQIAAVHISNNTLGLVTALLVGDGCRQSTTPCTGADLTVLTSVSSSQAAFDLPPQRLVGVAWVIVQPVQSTTGSVDVSVTLSDLVVRPTLTAINKYSSLASQLEGLFVLNEGSGTTTTNLVTGTVATFAGTTVPTWNATDPSVVFPGGAAGASYVNAGVDLALDALPTNQLTVAAKVWVTNVASAVVAAKSVGAIYFGSHGFVFGWDADGALRMQIGRAYTNYTAATRTGAVTAGRWIQVAMTWDPTTTSGHFFIDGIEQPLGALGAGDGGVGYTGATYQPLQIGTGSSNSLSGTMNGKLAYLAVYKGRMLSAAELIDLDSALPVTGTTATAITPNGAPITATVTQPGTPISLQFATLTTQQIATVQLTNNTLGSVTVSLIDVDGTVLRSMTTSAISFQLPATSLNGVVRIVIQPAQGSTGTIDVSLSLSDIAARPPLSLISQSSPLATQLAGLFVMNDGSGTTSTNLVTGSAATFAGSTLPTWNATDPSVVFGGGTAGVSYVNAGTDLALDALPINSLTVAAKVWVNTVAAGVIAAKSVGNAYFGAHGFVFGWDANGALRLQLGKQYTNLTASTLTGALTSGRWMQVAVTWDPATTAVRFFIDGVEQPNISVGGGSGAPLYTAATNQPFQIGTGSSNYLSGTMNGKLAYLAVYKGRLLTGTELLDLDSALPVTETTATAITPNAAAMTATVTQGGTPVELQFVTTTRQIATVQFTNNTLGSTAVSLKNADGSVLRTQTSSASSFQLPATSVNGLVRVVIQPTQSTTGTIDVAVSVADLPLRPTPSTLDTESSLSSQLVGLFVMNEASGTTTKNVVTSNTAAFSGTTAPTWNATDPSVVLPGGSAGVSYVDAGTDLIFDALPINQFTLAAKVWISTVAAGVVASKSVGTAYYGAHGFVFGWDANGALQLQLGKQYTNLTASSLTGTVASGRWMQVALTWDPATSAVRFFVDGVEQPNISVSGGSGGLLYTGATNQPFQIGTGSSNYLSGTMSGKVAWLAVYKGRQLTASELLELDAHVPVLSVIPPPSISSLNPTSGVVGQSVTITGAHFGSTQGGSTVTFNGIAATVTGWSDTSITATVPSGASSGLVVVTVSAQASNGANFTVIPPPHISSLNPTSGIVGQTVTITGTDFGASQGSSTVTFNGVAAATTAWSATSVTATVPTGSATGPVVITVLGQASNGTTFTVIPPPSISSLNPTSGAVGQAVTVTGTNFGSSQGTSTITFNGTAATATVWSATSITASVPSGATTGPVVVTVLSQPSNGATFTVAPRISSLSPTAALAGQTVTVLGVNFGATQGSSTITFNGTAATPSGWSATSITTTVPAAATTGPVVVTANGMASSGSTFTVLNDVTYHLHKEASDLTGLFRLRTAPTDAATTTAQSNNIGNSTGEILVKAFATDAGVPGVAGLIPSGSPISFRVYMRKTTSNGVMAPRVRARLDSATGTLLCDATGGVLPASVTQFTLSCTTQADVTLTSTSRIYLWVGVNVTTAPGGNTKGELSMESTNGSTDSLVTVRVPR